jgi:hypothetical protein
MAKSRLAEILKQEYKIKGVTSGTVSAIGKSLKEKMDLRNVLFGGSGIGSVIGRKIFGKGYSATPESSVATKISTPEQTFSSEAVTVLSTIATHSATSAKNSIVLPSMARDMHLVKQNIIKLIKISGGTPQTRAGDWLSRQMARETAYENSLARAEPVQKIAVTGKKESSGGFFSQIGQLLSNAFSGIKIALGSLLDLFSPTKLLKGLGLTRLFALLASPAFLGIAGTIVGASYLIDKIFSPGGWLDDWFKKNGPKPVSEMTDEEKVSTVSKKTWEDRLNVMGQTVSPSVAKKLKEVHGIDVPQDKIVDPSKPATPAAPPPAPSPAPATPAPQSFKSPSPVIRNGMELLSKVMDKEGVTDEATRQRITALAWRESTMNPDATGKVIPSGMHKGDQARGLLQIMPKTAPEVGFKAEDLSDPEKAATAGVRYFLKNLKALNGNLDAATIAHHAGLEKARQYLKTGSVDTKDRVTGLSTMDYLNRVAGTQIASASSGVQDGNRKLATPAPASVVVDNSVKTTNQTSSQNVPIATAYNDEFIRLLATVQGG